MFSYTYQIISKTLHMHNPGTFLGERSGGGWVAPCRPSVRAVQCPAIPALSVYTSPLIPYSNCGTYIRMKKQWNLRVEEVELEAWREVAASEHKLLASWIREVCNRAVEAHVDGIRNPQECEIGLVRDPLEKLHEGLFNPDPPFVVDALRKLPTVGQAVGKDADKPTGKHCQHGTAKGYRCWMCGGIARVE
jgi:hypothetical protein